MANNSTMSEAHKCDRCGELHPGEPKTTVNQTSGGTANTFKTELGYGEADLCRSCSKALKQFMEEPGGTS